MTFKGPLCSDCNLHEHKYGNLHLIKSVGNQRNRMNELEKYNIKCIHEWWKGE